jgi:signal transduction histidine kinase
VASHAAAWRGRWSQRFHLGLLVLFLLLLWLRALPALAGLPLPFGPWVDAVFPLLLLALAVFPVEAAEAERRRPLDFLYGVLILLTALLAGMSALLLTFLAKVSYTSALALVMVCAGAGLALFGWLWSPRGGFIGLGALFSARLLELGTPFERWSALLSSLAARIDHPDDFLASATAALVQLPGIRGGEWVCDGRTGQFGEATPYSATMHANGLRLKLYGDARIPTAMHVQFQLVAELLRQFHLAKEREQRLADYVYVEAVHETGARLTHDIKNLLQALKGLIGAADSHAAPADLVALYGRQLPEIARRLEDTLARLTAPVDQPAELVDGAGWWASAASRYLGDGVVFDAIDAPGAERLDALLFDSVLDNLLRNAIEKRAIEGAHVRIRAGLWQVQGRWMLWVEDTGRPVSAGALDDLFERPVASPSGYGLGLFQMARLAAGRGYRLQLASNQAGTVRFHLAPA